MFDFTLLTPLSLAWATMAFVATYASIYLALKKKWLRAVPNKPAIYYAGALLVAITIAAAALPLREEPVLLIGLVAAGVICIAGGLWDEQRRLRPSHQLIVQLVAATCAVVSGWTISYISQPTGTGVIAFNPWMGALLAIGWLLLLMNAMNWLDGVDGLATGVGGIALATLAAVSLLPSVQDSLTLTVSLIGAAALLGFMWWNFPPARVYLGTSGSWWLGLFIGSLAIAGGGKIVTTLLVLALPVVDVLLVAVGRLWARQPLWQGDTIHHLHHRLLHRGFSPRAITVTAIVVTAIFAIGAIVLQTEQKIVALALAFGLIIIAGSAVALTPTTTRLKHVALIGAAIVASILLATVVAQSPRPCRNFTESHVKIGDTTWAVAVADSVSEHAQGLMACEYLSQRNGMYFVFSHPTNQPFWMKNMVIPLDIVWIQDKTIIGIEHDVPPAGDEEDPPRYYAPAPYTAVLELSAGAAADFGLSVGDAVEIMHKFRYI